MGDVIKGPGADQPIECNVPEIGTVEGLDLGGSDADQSFAMRKWLEDAVTAAGAEVTDGGFGLGGADIGINLDGVAFGISIKPRLK